MTDLNNKKFTKELEAIYKEYLVEMKKIKNEQDELFKEYILRLDKKKKDKLIKDIKNLA